MDNNIDNLKKLIEKIRTIGFFERLFGWGKIKEHLIDAVADLQKIITNSENLQETNAKLEVANSGLIKDLELANTTQTRQAGELENLKRLNQQYSDKIN